MIEEKYLNQRVGANYTYHETRVPLDQLRQVVIGDTLHDIQHYWDEDPEQYREYVSQRVDRLMGLMERDGVISSEHRRIPAKDLQAGLFIKDKIFSNKYHEVIDVKVTDNYVHVASICDGKALISKLPLDEVFIVF